jgi:prevent-host-death family protein
VKAYKVAEARAKLGALLDEAESGDDVVIERNGIRFRVTTAQLRRTRTAARRPFAHVDRDVLSGSWTWSLGPRGLSFQRRRHRS